MLLNMTLKVKAGNENINKIDYASSKKKKPKIENKSGNHMSDNG